MRSVTLCLLNKDKKILLAMKKRGFGVGKWNGVGGKVAAGETIEAAALREMEEEIGTVAKIEDLENAGNVKFYFSNKPEWNQHMHIFFVSNWSGEPRESEEMMPQWYGHSEIPFEKMWIDDAHWLPMVLKGKKIEAEFYFNEDGDKIEKFDIKEV